MLYMGFPFARRFVRKLLEVTPENVARGEAIAEQVFDEVAERLSDGRRFLNGDDFTAEDITFACMAAAVLSPPNYGTPLPTLDEFPDDAGQLITRFRAHPGGQYAMKLFTEHRPIAPSR
ncbi:MAG: glutathione S-transferase C-terminal domain-containing protein [Bradymonadia bacterium]